MDTFLNGPIISLTYFLPDVHSSPEKLVRLQDYFTTDACDAYLDQTWHPETGTFSTTQDEMVSALPTFEFDMSMVMLNEHPTPTNWFTQLQMAGEATTIAESVLTHNTTQSIASTTDGSFKPSGDPLADEDTVMEDTVTEDVVMADATAQTSTNTSTFPSSNPDNIQDSPVGADSGRPP